MAAGDGLLTQKNQNDPTKNSNYTNTLGMPGGFEGLPLNQGQQQMVSQADGYANQYFNNQQSGPYRGGMQTSFNFNNPSDVSAFSDKDSDVRNAANTQYEMQHPTSGTDMASVTALNNMYQGRIGTKNSLAESIQGSGANEHKQEDILTGAAGQAEGQGLKNTRQNYNNRGLLYSGLRQSGEQQVSQGVGSSLDQSISGAKRDAANSLSGAQNAYAAVDLANAQESLNLAHSAFDTASQNNIARMQAMQQLGQGVGAVAGYAYGNMGGGQATSPTNSWAPQQLEMPRMGSQFGGQ